ncbi:hypothetical protein QBC34DRAFT_401548 [Podospora aff. communis PSN243]|uniref:F-box domain-containing protein n=1 Tax=Podospora aff. communis PSN243 TaxID=3040156 RepID=A0AAV9GR04_9PEZI|nr:hypothetical protein QBC34DRAFT_401548 [Podospora aff. communis PSN243]
MPTPKLTSLPIEVLARICECLTEEPALLSSLVALSLTNKHLHSIANPLLLHDIHLNLNESDPAQLTGQVQECRRLLRCHGAFRQVRRLFIDDSDETSEAHDPSDHDHSGQLQLRRSQVAFDADPLPTLSVLDIFADADLPKGIYCILRRPVVNDFDTVEDTYANDAAWHPLLRLLGELSGLRELHFSCKGQFPPRLLHTLQSQPSLGRCKLFINAFRLRSLLSPTPDPHELQLITSPFLHRLRMACWREEGPPDKLRPDDVDVARYIMRMAPNLKEIFLDHNIPKHFHRRAEKPNQTSPPWITTADHAGPASLETLFLTGNSLSNWQTVEMEKWMASTDFSKLRTLSLNFRNGVAQYLLQSLLAGAELPRLTTLVLSIAPDNTSYRHAAEHLLSSLPSLTELHLLYFKFSTPLLRLGPQLRVLSLRGIEITAHDVRQLGEDCPSLERLGITVKRSHGDSAEAKIYRSLGKFLPRLQHLSLYLDVPLPAQLGQPDPDFDEFDRKLCPGSQYLNGHLRKWLLNNAMDESLARSIFDAISSSKISPNEYRHVPLKTLKIQFLGGWARYLRIQGHPRLEPILSEIRKPWLLTRSIRDDSNEIIAKTQQKFGKTKSWEIYHPVDNDAPSGLHGDDEEPYGFSEDVIPDPVYPDGPYAILDRMWPSGGKGFPWKWAAPPLHGDSAD